MGEGVEVERGGVALGVLESFLASRGVSSQPASQPRVHRLTNSYKVYNIQGQLIHKHLRRCLHSGTAIFHVFTCYIFV